MDQWVDCAWRPLGFWSRSLRPEQQRYSTYIRELLAIKFAICHFVNEISGRNLIVWTDHKPLLGTWKSPELQAHDPKAMNAINEISQFTSDIRYKTGKDLLVRDMLSRPFGVQPAKAYQVQPEGDEEHPAYVSPSATM